MWSDRVYKSWSVEWNRHSIIDHRPRTTLPFLPAEKIERRFNHLQRRATTEALKTFSQYVHDNWIISRTFPPATWSVYMEAVRTNNDLEGWHNALNRRAKGRAQLPSTYWSSYCTRKQHLSPYKSGSCPTEDWEDISARLIESIRRHSSAYGKPMKTVRKTQNSCWRHALI